MNFLRNQWYVACWSHEVPQDDFLGRTIANLPLLLMRTAKGDISVLEDRCCHRHAPLTLGRREGDCVRCMYHGLLFNTEGRCVEVPGQRVVPAALHVRSFPAIERDNWIWVWLGDPALARPDSLPDTASLDHPDWSYVPGYSHWDLDQRLVIDNLVDFTHLSYVHRRTLGGTEAMAQIRPSVTRINNGVQIEWWLIDVPPAPMHQRIRQFKGNIDRWFRYNFTLPGVLTMSSGTQDTGTGAQEGIYNETLIETRSCQAIMPETAASSHYFYASPHNLPDPDKAIAQSIAVTVQEAFAEDYQMIRAQQDRIEAGSGAPMLALPFDTALVMMRRMIEQRLAEEAEYFRTHGQPRPKAVAQ